MCWSDHQIDPRGFRKRTCKDSYYLHFSKHGKPWYLDSMTGLMRPLYDAVRGYVNKCQAGTYDFRRPIEEIEKLKKIYAEY